MAISTPFSLVILPFFLLVRKAARFVPSPKEEISLTETRLGSIIKIRENLQQNKPWRDTQKAFFFSALLLVAGSAVLVQTGCQKREYFANAKFVDLYVELKLATVGYANNLDKANEVRRVILAQHQETPAGFHAQYVQLMANPKAWRKFQDDVILAVEKFQLKQVASKTAQVPEVNPQVKIDQKKVVDQKKVNGK